jgi:hypothetical protein
LKKIIFALAVLVASLSAQAAKPESYAGKQPHALLKSAPDFARAYRAMTREFELPAWTKRLAAGQPAQIVEVGDSKRILTSACGKAGCLDERIYILFDPETKTATGFFFLPPAADDPGDSRTAFSQWLGKPGKEDTDFLLERAISDAQSLNKPNY